MTKRLLLQFVVLACALAFLVRPAFSQATEPAPAGVEQSAPEHSGAKHWYRSRVWWVGELINIGSYTAMAINSRQPGCRGCTELRAGLYGARPSTGKVVGIGIAAEGILTTMHAVEWHYSRGARLGWRIYAATVTPAAAGTGFGYTFAHDKELRDCIAAHLVCR